MFKPAIFVLLIFVCAAGHAFSAEGDLDQTFGASGVATFNKGVDDAAQAVARQSDGKIVIAGTVSNGSNTDIVIIRLTANGRRDTSFGFDGIVTFDTGNDDSARGVAVQPDGNIVVVGQTSNGTDNDILVIRRNSNGLPDTTFGVGLSGAVTFDLGNNETANAVAVQTNGRIVIAGTASNGANNDLLIMRLLISGPPDTTFSAGGFLTIDRGGNDSGRAVAVQTNGQIVAAGASSNGSNADIIIVRVNVDGLPDVSFNFNGIVTIDQGGSDSANAVAVQPNGQIVAAGTSSNGSNADIIVVRVNANGLPDTSFNFNGIVTIDRDGNDSGNALVLQLNGKILVTGTSSSGADENCITVRLNPNGFLDTSFRVDGTVIFQGTAGGDDSGNAVAVQPDGKILVAGAVTKGLNTDLLALRYTQEGIPDTTFNGDGIFTFSTSAKSADAGNAVALQANGKIVVAGQTSSGGNDDLLVVRYNTDGTRDTKFSNDGVFIYNSPANGDDTGKAAAIQPLDNKVVIVGQTSGGADSDLLVLRLNANGTLDTTFSGDGITAFDGAANNDDIGNAVALQADGKIIVVGQSSNGVDNDVLVLRYDTNGALDSTFGVDGVSTYNSGREDIGRAVAVQADNSIIVVGVSSNGTDNDLLMIRYNANGTLDTSFGTGGAVIYDGGNNDAGRAVAVQPADDKIVVAGSSSNGTKNRVLTARFNLDGTVDTTFNASGAVPGTVTYNSGNPGNDVGNTVAVQADGKIVVAGLAGDADVLLLRYEDGGTLDTTFSGNGVQTFNGAADGVDAGRGIVIQPDGKIVVAGVSDDDLLVLRYIGQKTTVIGPNGGEVLIAGSPSTITWTAPPKAVFFTLALSVDNGQTWGILASNVTGSTYPWTVSVPLNNKRTCLIRVTGYDAGKVKVNSDQSDDPFVIEVVKLTFPNGGETFTAGNPLNIAWTTHATKRPVDTVQLYYTLNGGNSWLLITAPISGNPGTFSWTAPPVSEEKKKGKVKVVLKDIQGKTVGSDTSDAFITFK